MAPKKTPQSAGGSSGMKQKSIASFFAARPKPAAAPAAAATPPPSAPAAAAAAAGSPKQTPPAADVTPVQQPAAAAASPSKGAASRQSPAAKKQQQQATPAAAAAPGAAANNKGSGGSSPGGQELVGRRVQVLWPAEGRWFTGRITAFRQADGHHHVEYDDGDEDWHNLATEQHKLLAADAKTKAGGSKAQQQRRRRQARIESDDDDDDDGGASSDGGGDSDSDFKAEGADDDEDEDMADLESEGGGDDDEAGSLEDEDDDDDDGEAGPGSKRKRAAHGSKAARKRPGKAAAPAGTPEGAAAAAAGGASTGLARGLGPSSAGHTPMDRFACGPGSGGPRTTPLQGFFPSQAAQTPPHTAGASSAAGTTPGATPLTQLTPDTAAKAALQGALDVTPAAGKGARGAKQEPNIVLGVLASGGAEAARFAARMAERFNFLRPDQIKDKAGRRPQDPDYDPRSLRIPDGWFKQHKVTEAQQQWWRFKSSNFDSVLLFKVGKFYEMFEMDAFVGVDVLGLSFMKGEQPHAGFPEAAYHGMAEQLARAGYRVVVVEQTETPDQLKERNARRPPGAKAATVVERQAVAVLSRGTMLDPEMVAGHPDAAYVLAVVEVAEPGAGHDAPFVGACALDAAAGQLLVGSWRDDEVRLKLRTQLTGLRPVEVVLPRRGSEAMSAVTSRLVRCGASRGPEPALNELPASAADAADTLKALSKYFPEGAALPPLVQQLQAAYADAAAGGDEQAPGGSQAGRLAEAALGALGLMVSFLRANMLDAALLPAAKYEPLVEGVTGSDEPVAMELNGAALEGLEVLENALGGTQGSLLGLLDHCATPFGRRRLRRWLTRPLYRVRDIEARQDAVEELMGPADAAMADARRALAGCSDLERCLARLAASVGPLHANGDGASGSGGSAGSGGAGSGGGFGREAAHVVLYEDVARRRVRVLVGALRDLRALQAALAAFSKAAPSGPASELLAALTDGGRWQAFGDQLEALSGAAEWGRAEADGVVRPSQRGVDAAYDAASDSVEAADKELQAYLGRVRKELDCRAVTYVSLNKDSHVLEVPEGVAGRMPDDYALVGHRKGFKRYSSDELRELVAAREAAEEQRERVEAGVLRSLERLFVSHHELWTSAIEAVGVLDCLMALAGAALGADGGMCRPKLLQPAQAASGDSDGGQQQQNTGSVFRATQLRHPAGVVAGGSAGSFVPNDIQLGGDAPAFILLTGPNMGGKSTLLRQVCLAAVLAQVGAMVPAASLELTPMDGCFVRMGARDAILSGQSTFYIEMAETAAMLARATPRSLVALDELGRGTATLDGAAIAAAVLDHLAHATRCCGLFATHYHQLAVESASDPAVAIMHMACAVAEQPQQQQPGQEQQSGDAAGANDQRGRQQQQQDEVAEVTFLYKLTAGACPKSYGTNVARLAGLPASVVTRAAEMSGSREAAYNAGAAAAAGGRAGAGGPPRAASKSGGGEPMDVDSKGGGELPQLLRSVRGQLQQLAQAAGDGVDAKLLQLQQQAAQLCKCA